MKNLSALISILLILTAFQSSAAIVGLTPGDESGYKKIFGYESSGKELQQIERAIEGARYPVVRSTSLAVYQSALHSSSGLIIVVGHNEAGFLRFADGSRLLISEIEAQLKRAGKLGVILTCNGSCYTALPSPRLKISYLEAFRLAGEIQHKFNNMDKPKNTDPAFDTRRQSMRPGAFSSTQMSSKQCAALLSSARLPQSRPPNNNLRNSVVSAFQREARKAIFRSEIEGVIRSSAKVALAGSGTILIVALFDVDEN